LRATSLTKYVPAGTDETLYESPETMGTDASAAPPGDAEAISRYEAGVPPVAGADHANATVDPVMVREKA